MARVDVPLSAKISQAKTNPAGSYIPGLFPKVGGGYDLLPISYTNLVKTLSDAIISLQDTSGSSVVYRFVNKSSNFSQNLLNSEKIESIDIRFISGSPIIKIGITPDGEEILEAQAIELMADNSDFNIMVSKSFNAEITLYFTITGGNISLTLSTRKNIFE